MPRTAALIPAAGRGLRVGEGRNKLLLPLDGHAVILLTVRTLHDHPGIDTVTVIAADSDRPELDRIFRERERWPKLQPWVSGGAERQESVANGLAALEARPPDWVLIHDGARPFCSPRLIERLLAALRQSPAVVPVLPISDTVRRIELPAASAVLERERLFRTQTPQGFYWSVIREAHRLAGAKGLRGTDDAQLVEAMRSPIAFVEGEARNIKLTAGTDFHLGAWILANPEWGV
jgi:2-C-methyl-D-erythritol 4-phosphate cytidylyltransferase